MFLRLLLLPRQVYYFLLFCFLPSAGNSQSSALDSARFTTVLDTATINNLSKKAKQQSNPDSAIFLYRQMQSLSLQINYADGVASALFGIGLLYIDLGNYQQAIDTINKAYPFCIKAADKTVPTLYYNNIGLAYFSLGDYVHASENYHNGLKELNKSFKEPQPLAALIYNNLAAVQIRLKQYDKALMYLNRGEDVARKGGFKKRLAMILGNKGIYYSDCDQLDSADRYFRETLVIGKEIKSPMIQAASNINIGDVLIKRKQDLIALTYFDQAIKISDSASLIYTKVMASYSMGEALNNLKRYRESEKVLLAALRLASKINLQEDILRGYNNLAEVYKSTKQYAKASAIQDTLLALKDSLMSTEKTKAINTLEVKYRTAEKDKQLAIGSRQLAEKERNIAQKNLQIGGILGGTLLLGLSMIWLHRRDRYKQHLQKQQIKSLEHEQEIGQLKAMVRGEEKERARIASELHDSIVGQLAAIKMNFSAIQHEHNLDHLNDYEEALQQLSDASDDVRKTAHNLMPGVLLQGGLTAAVQHYCRKMGKNLDINFQHFGDLPRMDADFELSAYRIVQELVQNVIKHARATKALVQISYTNGMLSITVEDNGRGMNETSNEDSGFGLKNLSTRVKAFGGHIEVESSSDAGTTVYVEFEVGDLLVEN